MSFNAYTPPGLWDRTRLARLGFIVGIIVGVVIGWFFHGVVSLFLRLGVLISLMIPLLIILWLWWRSSRSYSPRDERRGTMTWVDTNYPRKGGFGRGQNADDQVYDLDDLKRETERNR